jgi:hypothetical protein
MYEKTSYGVLKIENQQGGLFSLKRILMKLIGKKNYPFNA